MSGEPDELVPFVVRPRPLHGESYDGYLMRVTEANDYPSASYVIDHGSGFQYSSRLCRAIGTAHGEARKQLTRQLGLPEDELDHRWPIIVRNDKQDERISYGRITLHRDLIMFGAGRICPDCVREDGIIQELWEIQLYTVCHRHQRLLLSHCPTCGAQPSLWRGRLAHCGRCGNEFPTGSTTRVAPEETRLATALAKGYADGDHPCADLSDYAPLFGGGLLQGLEILRHTVRMLLPKRTPWPGTRSATAHACHEAVLGMLGLFRSWPSGWHAHLTDQSGTCVVSGRGIRKMFEREFRQCEQHQHLLEFMHEALVDWLLEHHPGAASMPSMRPLVGRADDHLNLMTIDEAAAQLGVSRNSVLKWADQDRFTVKRERVGGDERLFLEREAVNVFQAARENVLTFKDAAQILGVSSRVLNRIVDAGLLQVISGTIAGTTRYVPRDAIDSFWSMIEAHVVGPRGCVISITAALAMMAPVWSGIVPLLEAVIHDELPVASIDRGRGLLSLRISKSHLTRILAVTDNRQNDSWITVGEAATLFHVSRKRVYWLLEKRVLSSEDFEKYGAQPRCRLNLAECHAFHRRYVSLDGLVRESGYSKYTLARRLSWASIEPARFRAGHSVWDIFERESAESMVARLV